MCPAFVSVKGFENLEVGLSGHPYWKLQKPKQIVGIQSLPNAYAEGQTQGKSLLAQGCPLGMTSKGNRRLETSKQSWNKLLSFKTTFPLAKAKKHSDGPECKP